jgi:hypothetical protein
MPKSSKTAFELSEIICRIVGIPGMYVTVRQDHALGWQPTVVEAPGNLIFCQRRVEEVAHKLRMQYDLQRDIAQQSSQLEQWR